jgi:hypothetical protein
MWQGETVRRIRRLQVFPAISGVSAALAMLMAFAAAATDTTFNGAAPAWHAPPLSQSRMFRWRDTNGQPQWGPRNETLSHNWSGYGLSGGPYTSVQASWVVPTVSYETYPGSPGVEVSSTWIGIGGQDGDETLIQIGTQQMAAPSGKKGYFAWYEILPDTEVPIDSKQYPVSAGDTISAQIQCTAACRPDAISSWVLTLSNGNRWPKPYSITLAYSSSLSSVEWIVEGPCVNNCDSATPGFAFLPNYGTTTFSAITVNDTIPKLALSPNGIVMKDPNGNATSTPSDLIGGNSFTVSFAI